MTFESSKLFGALAEAELQALRGAARDAHFAAGTQIFKEGDPGDGIYLVKTGSVQISALLENGERHVFAQVRPGDVFGEMAALDNQPRSATATAEQETTAHFIPRDDILRLLRHSPELSILLVQEISGRLREFNHLYIRKLLQAERISLVGRFASSVVHDLKNPLTLISLTSESLCAHPPSDEIRKSSHDLITKQVERITNLVNDILDFTRGEPAKLVMGRFDFAQVANELVEEFRIEATRKSVKLEIENAPPAVRIPLDPRRLSRVFHNLFSNAIDAMAGPGKITLRFELTEREVLTEIEDSGKGLAPEVAARLFEAFFTFGKARGTGLGLAIARKIVQEHQGTISARNRPGGGAVFSFTLPR